MSQHYRCDICRNEISTRVTARQETVYVRGSRAGINLTVSAHVQMARSGTTPDVCGKCFKKAIVQAFGIELVGAA